MTAAFDIRLLGAIEIRRNGELLTGFRSQKALVLLTYLLCEERTMAREYLAGLGWPESDQSQALGLLRRSLYDLQRQLPDCLDIDNRTVRFNPAASVTVDLRQFSTLAAQPDPQAWAQAVALYRAPFLQGIYLADAPDLENWLLREQERWQGELVRLLNGLAAYHCGRAATNARSMDDKKEIAFCLDFIGKTVWWQESGLAALPFLEESLFICRAIGDQVGIASTLDTLAAVCDMSSEFPQAWQFAHEGLTISRAIGHTSKTASILRRLGSTSVGLGKYDMAISYYQEAATMFRQVGDNYGLVQALAELGRAMYGSRKYPRDIFIGVLEEAATIARKLGQAVPLYYTIGILGHISNWIGEYATGKRCGQELGEISQQMPPSLFAAYRCLLGEVEVGLGNLHLARQLLLEAMTLMLKTETRLLFNCQIALLAWANLLCRECTQTDLMNQPSAIQQRQTQALEVVSSLLHETKARPMYKDRGRSLAVELEKLLPLAIAAAAKERGKRKTQPQLVAEIIEQEASSSGYSHFNLLHRHNAR